ncbi:MAG: 4-hydroxy-tetrahydrodipicolinate reductase [Deltaproteobacteria bacterium]|nr:4-hydroxy-tetrahydrodipicolinate reductase [Deltaproteobacteria bacterium]
MKERTGIFVTGAGGRMGKSIIRMVLDDKETILQGASERADHAALGQDAGLNAGCVKAGVAIMTGLDGTLKAKRGVIVDFSSVEATLLHVKIAVERRVPLVIGTTGFNDGEIKKIFKAGDKIPLVFAPNMSIGMNLMFKIAATTAQTLGDKYNIEILEAHHKNKTDAPSGTARRLAQILCEATGRKYPDDVKDYRSGMIGVRAKKEIGMQVLRGGDIVGEHTVYYCGEGERVEIRHMATSRDTFAGGAIRAAKWLYSKKTPGVYGMWDVLQP